MMARIGAAALMVVLLGGVAACQVAAWRECRTQFSRLTCALLISR